MRKIGVALLALVWAAPAWAGCSNWAEDTDHLLGSAPRAKVCISGACEETALDYSCGNASSAQWGYHNGLAIDVKVRGDGTAGGQIVAIKNGHKIALRRIKCTEIDQGACFIVP